MSKSQGYHNSHEEALQLLNALIRDVGACCVFLVNVMGNAVLSAGEQETIPMDEINALLGGSISALVQAGKTLDDQQRDFNLVYQREGSRHHLFSINVGENMLMTLLIPKTQFGVHIGGVMHYSRRVAKELSEILRDEGLSSKPSELPGNFREDLNEAISDSMDALFAQSESQGETDDTPSEANAQHTDSTANTTQEKLLTYEDAVKQGIFSARNNYLGGRERTEGKRNKRRALGGK